MSDFEMDVSFLSGVSTACISDALDVQGVDGGCQGIRPLVPGLKLHGPAYTVRFEPVTPGESAPAADYIDDVPAGAVVVIDNGGRTHCTVWGDILAAVAQARGINGTVIDGAARDATDIIALRYPLFSRTAFMKSGKNRVRMSARQLPVTIGGTLVRPGDLVFGDDSGVIVVPAENLSATASIARDIEAMEQEVMKRVQAGEKLQQARAAVGYNRFALKQASSRQERD